jgi:transposase InsO family protein
MAEAVRIGIRGSKASVRALTTRYGVSPMTIQKWRKRDHAHNAAMGPKQARSSTLTLEQEAEVVAFRRHTPLPLDDCLYALQPSLPHLSRSSLHRCLERHGISRLPEIDGDKPDKRKFKTYPSGFFHLDIAEARTGEGKLYLFVAIDRTSKFTVVRLTEAADRQSTVVFLDAVIQTVPYRIHTVLTGNGIQFRHPPRYRSRPMAQFSMHLFDRLCRQHGIEHRLTKPNHPWTTGRSSG